MADQDYAKAVEGVRQYLFALQAASAMRLPELLQEVISKAAGAEAYVVVKQKEVESLLGEVETAKAKVADQQKRADEARKASDDVVAAVSGLAETAKSEYADLMKKMQDEAGSKQAEWDTCVKKYEADKRKLEAEKAAAEAAAKQVYLDKAAKYDAEIEAKRLALAQIQAAYDALKAKLLS